MSQEIKDTNSSNFITIFKKATPLLIMIAMAAGLWIFFNRNTCLSSSSQVVETSAIDSTQMPTMNHSN